MAFLAMLPSFMLKEFRNEYHNNQGYTVSR
jgi:hypothetical protein